ncbi:MAG: hypothetical protein ABJG41_09960 [Cyclobacteriaceae bacterium]
MNDITTYKVSFLGYHIYLGYRNKRLWIIQLPDKGLPRPLQSQFLANLDETEKALTDYNCFYSNHKMFELTKKQLGEPKTQQDKIIVFGMAFKHYRGVAYQAKDQEKANIKHVPVSRKLLETFFTTPGLTNYTVENYIQRINITRDYAVNGFPDARFPDQWDREFWRNCDDKTRMMYEKSLVAKGYQRKTTGLGTNFVREVAHG